MCGGVKFKHDGKILTVYFPSPKAVLPVALKQGGHELVMWGRRKEEPGKLPAGGWARLDSIKASGTDSYPSRCDWMSRSSWRRTPRGNRAGIH